MKFLIVAVLMFSVNLWAESRANNGGDICEKRIQNIRDDLKKWIFNGGYKYLNMPIGAIHKNYKIEMIKSFNKTIINCTTDKLYVGNAEKTCKNIAIESNDSNIKNSLRCNFDRFNNTDQESQYELIHHEYAGVSGFEINRNEESNYFLTNQITAFLEDVIIKKLAIKPSLKNLDSTPVEIGDTDVVVFLKNDSIERYENGIVKSGRLAFSITLDIDIAKLALKKGAQFEFYKNSMLSKLYIDQIQKAWVRWNEVENRVQPGTTIGFNIEGNLEKFTVFNSLRFDLNEQIFHSKKGTELILYSSRVPYHITPVEKEVIVQGKTVKVTNDSTLSFFSSGFLSSFIPNQSLELQVYLASKPIQFKQEKIILLKEQTGHVRQGYLNAPIKGLINDKKKKISGLIYANNEQLWNLSDSVWVKPKGRGYPVIYTSWKTSVIICKNAGYNDDVILKEDKYSLQVDTHEGYKVWSPEDSKVIRAYGSLTIIQGLKCQNRKQFTY